MSSYDVIVLGAGTWGSSAAWQLAERGRHVLAIDAYTPPHDHGSHAGATRLARQSNSTGPEYTDLTKEAFEAWNRIAERTGIKVMVKTGNVFIGRPGSRWFDNTLANLTASPFHHEILVGSEARIRLPFLRIDDDELAVWEPDGGVSLVQPALRAIQQLGREAGVEVRYAEKVINWSADDSGVVVRTTSDEYVADRLVITAGAFSNKVAGLALPTRVERQVLVNFQAGRLPSRLPSVFIAAAPGDDSAPSYGCPEPDGTFKFSVPTKGNIIEPESLSQDVTVEDLEKVQSVVRDRIPDIGDAMYSTVCMWTESEDGHWLCGRHPESDRVVIGAGCNGRGFRYAPVVGSLLADLTEDKAYPAPSRFDLSRCRIIPLRG